MKPSPRNVQPDDPSDGGERASSVHELNNLLMLLSLNTELLAARAGDDDDMQRRADEMLKAVERLRQLIHQILTPQHPI